MPRITIKDTGTIIEATMAVSILNNLMRSGVPIQHVCGGKARCGTCRITIIEGAEFLTPKKEDEIIRLKAVGAGEKERLACQTYTRGDITISIGASV